MRYPDLQDVRALHRRLIETAGGSHGIRDIGALESAIAQPEMTFGGQELYPTLHEKAAAIAFSIVMNHPFIDGNKRAGHGAVELLLRLNGYRIVGELEEQERMFLALAAGEMEREAFVEWVREHIQPLLTSGETP
ncbi:MAG TPA: type II toxin-antitoxin system death-on-curing family toxin [Chthonomonadaceae bacterium]|nr:type II toxin-antitoxin system death-on-curing family toxin [Chthonomonadaceae bacterium]